jgi:hypothetical protein
LPISSLDLTLPTMTWAQAVKDTSSVTAPLNMLLAEFATIANLHLVIHNKFTDDRRALAHAHLPTVPFSFLGLMPSSRQSFNRCGGIMIQSEKPLADHVEILHSSDIILCRYPKLPSTHTTCGKLPTSTAHSSSTMTPFAAILQASKASSDPSRISLLSNTCVRPWHRAPHALTFC